MASQMYSRYRSRRVTLKVCIGMVVLRPRELMKVINETEHKILRFMDFWFWLWRDSPTANAEDGCILRLGYKIPLEKLFLF